MIDIEKRLRLQPPISDPPHAPARSGCTRRSNHPFGATLCRCSLHRLQPTIGRNAANFRDRTQGSGTVNHCDLDGTPKNDPASQAA